MQNASFSLKPLGRQRPHMSKSDLYAANSATFCHNCNLSRNRAILAIKGYRTAYSGDCRKSFIFNLAWRICYSKIEPYISDSNRSIFINAPCKRVCSVFIVGKAKCILVGQPTSSWVCTIEFQTSSTCIIFCYGKSACGFEVYAFDRASNCFIAFCYREETNLLVKVAANNGVASIGFIFFFMLFFFGFCHISPLGEFCNRV